MSILINVPYLQGPDINADGSLTPEVGKGKPVVIMMQGDFCGYCTQAKPDFQKFANESKNVQACTVQIDDQDPSGKEAGVKLKVINQAPGVPAYLGFGANGRYKASHNGGRDFASLMAFASSL